MLYELGRMLLSLSIVLGLLWVIARVGRGRQVGGRPGRAGTATSTQRIEMLGRRSLGRHSAVFVIRAGNRTMVVGQTAQQITVLAECEPDEPEGPDRSNQPEGPEVVGDGTDTAGRGEDVMPGLASETGVLTPKAWDAFVDRVREMTVRH
jgi:flagellar biogenesis protein FliO